MIWFTLLLPAAMVALGVWKWKDWDFGAHILVVSGGLVLLTLTITYPTYTVGNGNELAKQEAFYEYNTQNFSTTVDDTASYLSIDSFIEGLLVEGSLERAQLATAVSERIAEFRDAVNEYNIAIASMQYYDRNIFIGVLYPDAVQDMKPLVIQ